MAGSIPSRDFLAAFSRSLRYRVTTPAGHKRTFLNSARRLKEDKKENVISQESLMAGQSGGVTEEARRQAAKRIGSGKLAPSIFDAPLEAYGELKDELKTAVEAPSKAKDHAAWQRTNWRKKLRPTVKDPQPRARVQWQRRMVIRDVKGRHRMSKTEKILRSERYHLAKSHFIKTSIKKLGPLARQIAGKPIEEALIQMRFSKKKAAQDVLKHLKYARDQAIAAKGMGLGTDIAPGVERPEGKEGLGRKSDERIEIRDKKGKRRVITDSSAIYVDESWVGRGEYGTELDYRARGQAYVMKLPSTSISVVLKEEATRIRKHKEFEEKKRQKKPWVQLPDRPVTAQRQFPLW